MHVKVATDVAQGYQLRDLAGQGSLHLSPVLPKLGWHILHAQPLVDLLFREVERTAVGRVC